MSASCEIGLARYLLGVPPAARDDARKAYRVGWHAASAASGEIAEQSIRELTDELEHEQQRSAALERGQERMTQLEAVIADVGRNSTHELVRYWLDKTVKLEAQLGASDTSWLVKDFHVLYRCAKRVADACGGLGASPGSPLQELDAQLQRLLPAFAEACAHRSPHRCREFPSLAEGQCKLEDGHVGEHDFSGSRQEQP